MARRIIKRFFFSCVTIFFVIAFNFFLFRVMPGDVETIIAKANSHGLFGNELYYNYCHLAPANG